MSAELYNLLVIAYTCSDNALRQDAEHKLTSELMKDVQNFQYIAQVGLRNDQMQSYAVSAINTIVLKMLSSNIQISTQHAQIVNDLIISPQTALKNKQLLQKCMSLMIRLQKVTKIEIENQIKQLLQSETFNLIQSGLFYFKVLIESIDTQYSLSTNQNFDWIIEFFDLTSPLFKVLTDSNYQFEDEYQLTIRYYFQIVKELCEKVFKPKHFNKEAFIPLQKLMLESATFQYSLFIMFQYSPQQNIIKDCIIIHTQNEQFDTKMNEIKMYCFKCLQLIINILLNSKSKQEQRKSVFYSLQQNVTQLTLYSIFLIMNQISIKEILNKAYLPNILCSLLRLLSYFGGQTEMYNQFAEVKIPLITDIIYPLLITTQQEYQVMKEMPEEFVNASLDVVDKQEAEIPQTAAAQLLETLCDHIDGSTSFIAQLSIIVIQSSVLELNNSQTQQLLQYKKLSTEFTPIDRIESSLLILTIISYLIQKRPDIIQLMEHLLLNNIQFFTNNTHSIIKVRFALFFGYYCDNLFKSDVNQNTMIQYIQLLIQYIQPHEPVVLYQTVDALKDIFEDDDLKQKTNCLIGVVFPQLISGLSFSTYERHFEMITNLLLRFPQIFVQQENLLLNLIQIVVQRIQQEENLVKSDSTRFIHLNRCFNLIRIIPNINEFLPLFPQIESKLTPIYEMMVINQECMSFEEDLLLFTSSVIEKSQKITLLQQQILPYFSKLIKKQSGRFGHIYEILNSYMYYGKNVIFANEQLQRTYFDLCLYPLINEESFEDVDLGESALLIQLGIEVLRNDLNLKILETIFQQVIKLINNTSMTGIVRSRVTAIFLAAFYFIPQITYQILGEVFQTIFQKVLVTQYHPGYDIKLFIITMCQLVQEEPDYLVVVQVMVRNLKLQDQEEKMNDVEEDEMNDEDDDYMEQEDRMTAKQQIDQFKGSLVDIDEFSHFKNFIFTLKQQKPQVIEKMKSSFDSTTMQQLKELLSFVRIGGARQLITIKKRKNH